MTVRAKTSGSAYEIRDRELRASSLDTSVDRVSRRTRRGYSNRVSATERNFAGRDPGIIDGECGAGRGLEEEDQGAPLATETEFRGRAPRRP